MSVRAETPPTLREKSTWTPRHDKTANIKIFQERLELIKKWYSAWNESQRWDLLQYILLHLPEKDILYIHSLIDPLLPKPKVEIREDFTKLLPRSISLKIFSYLDPRSLCRTAQVSWYWHSLCEHNALWRSKCLRYEWFLPSPTPLSDPNTIWKRHYVSCVNHMTWNPPKPPLVVSPPISPPTSPSPPPRPHTAPTKRRRRKSETHHTGFLERPPWRHSDKYPKELAKATIYNSSLKGKSRAHSHIPSSGTRPQPYVPGSYSVSTLPVLSSTPSDATPLKTLPPKPHTSTRPKVPLSSLLHPSLMEKLRLGSPTDELKYISTIHHPEREEGHRLAEKVHHIQDSSPFPHLPPYYIHAQESSKEDVTNKEHSCGGFSGSDEYSSGGDNGLTTTMDGNSNQREMDENNQTAIVAIVRDERHRATSWIQQPISSGERGDIDAEEKTGMEKPDSEGWEEPRNWRDEDFLSETESDF